MARPPEFGSASEDDSKVQVENGHGELPEPPETAAGAKEATVEQVRPPDRVAGWQDLVKLLLDHATAVVGGLGLLVYAVVRVAHDSFYGHFGIAPEDVGLTQATILGRAGLYLVFFLAVAGAVAGVWMCGMVPLYRRREVGARRMRLVVAPAFAALAALAAAVAFLAPNLAGVLDVNAADACGTSNRFCTTASLVPGVSLAVVLGVPLLLLAAVLGYSIRFSSRRPSVALGAVALLAVAVAVIVPELFVLLDDLAEVPRQSGLLAGIQRDDLTWLEREPLLIRIAVVVVAGFGLAASCTAFVRARIAKSPGDPVGGNRVFVWGALSFLVVLPAVLGFLAPGVAGFLTETMSRFVTAVVAWLALFGAALLGLQKPDRDAWIPRRVAFAAAFAAIAASALFLSWERGKAMAEFAETGNRLVSRHFRLLSVRTDVVCLKPVKKGDRLPGGGRDPYLYLGQSNGMLVLFDYQRLQDIKRRERELGRTLGAPKTLPIRVPATTAYLEIARIPESTWTCP